MIEGIESEVIMILDENYKERVINVPGFKNKVRYTFGYIRGYIKGYIKGKRHRFIQCI